MVKYAAIIPPITPSNKYNGNSAKLFKVYCGTSNIGLDPIKDLEMAVAITDEIIIGENAFRLKSASITSTANTTPAIGALKTAASPAAVPHPTRIFNLSDDT